MDTFTAIGEQLIKVEVNEIDSSTFQCIICAESFMTRADRNEHLERHFVHRKCRHCDKAVISIGDLDFELHRPVHCRTIADSPCPAPTTSSSLTTKSKKPSPKQLPPVRDAYKSEDDDEVEILPQKFCEIHVVSNFKSESIDMNDEGGNVSPRKSRRRRIKVNYNEDDDGQRVQAKTLPKKSSSPKKEESQNDVSNELLLFDIENGSKAWKEDDGGDDDDDNEENEIVFDMKFDEISDADSGKEQEDEREKQIDDEIKRKRKWKWGSATQIPPKTIPCPDCDQMFRVERTLKSHRKKDHGFVQRNICAICGREFKDAGNLNQHMNTHGEHKRYICNYCGKGFHMPYNLKEHMHQHTGERPYPCSVCGKTFNRQTLRSSHMRIHTGEKPFKCKYENCDRAYAYSTDLKRHKRSAHGEIGKTFPCPICGKVFYENKFLTKHLNVHQGKM